MIRASLQDRLVEAAGANGNKHLVEYLLTAAKECVYVFEEEEPGSIRVGGSRLGGLPDLPTEVEWPRGVDDDGRPWRYADFVAQLDFAEIPEIDALPLPAEGRLWFFMRAWRKTEVLLAIVQAHEPESLSPRELPTITEWAAFPTLGLEQDRPMTTGSLPLRFEVGISLPFGNHGFNRAFKALPALLYELYEKFLPSTRQGQIGGYAYNTSEGHNHRLNVELAQRGMRDYIFPLTYETVNDLNQALGELPTWLSQNPKYVEKLEADLERIRPRVAWIEEHKEELNEWVPFVCFDSNDAIGLDWGRTSASLWTFVRAADLLKGDLRNLVGESVV
jgi:hypothetical protein